MTSHAFRQSSTRCGLIQSLRLFTWVLLPARVISQESSPDDSSSSNFKNRPRAPQSDSSDDDSLSSLSRDGMLNLYFLFIAIAVILLMIALFLIHRRKKRRKAMMRNYGQNALAQDINGPGQPQAHARWIPGSRWGAASRTEEGLNERGEAPPPYHHPPPPGAGGGPPYAPPPNGYYVPMPMPGAPPPAAASPGWPPSDAGLAIPMRTLSRDTQGNKPPEYQDALQPGGQPPPMSPNSSTGNLVRHDGQNQALRP